MPKPIDLTGKVFGNLTVLEYSKRNRHNQKEWWCRCACGREKSILGHSLVSGNTKGCGSCGWYYKNKWELKGDIAVIDVSTSKQPKTFTIVDAEDIDRLILHNRRWFAHDSGGGCYVTDTDKKVKLHRFVLSARGNQIVDHINGDKLDNRKVNLRFVTPTENARNQRRRNNNSTGVTGVWFENSSGLYVAEICVGKSKSIFLGRYELLSEANIARKAAEKVLDYSPFHGIEYKESIEKERVLKLTTLATL